MNPKEFFSRWKEGMKNITPAQQAHAEMIGYLGNIVGMLFAIPFLLYKGMWYFIIFLGFTTFLQVVAYIGAKQKYEGLLKLMGPVEEDNKEIAEKLLEKLG